MNDKQREAVRLLKAMAQRHAELADFERQLADTMEAIYEGAVDGAEPAGGQKRKPRRATGPVPLPVVRTIPPEHQPSEQDRQLARDGLVKLGYRLKPTG